jgi:hypothetical protein
MSGTAITSANIARDGTPIFDHTDCIAEPWYSRLAEALDEAVKAREFEYPEFMAFIETVARALPFADGWCDRCRSDKLDFAMRIEPDGRDGWKAHYRCRDCGAVHHGWYATGWPTLVGMIEP